MWIKIIIRYTTSHLSEWLLSKRQEMTWVGENMEKGGTCTVGGNGAVSMENSQRFLQKLKIEPHMI